MTKGSGWVRFARLGAWPGALGLVRVLSAYRSASLALAAGAAIVAAAAGVRKVHQSGETVSAVVAERRGLARARVDSPEKVHASAPVAAGFVALASWPAVILALVATRYFGAKGVYLPPEGDARIQFWSIAVAVLGAVVALDYWFGLGTTARTLTTDGFAGTTVGATLAMAALPSLMIFREVESRPAWIGLIVAQFCWSFAGVFLGGIVSKRRKKRLVPLVPLRSSARLLAENRSACGSDLILESPGVRKILVIKAVRTVTGMGLKEAKDLVDNAPGLVMQDVTSERAERAKELLESLGATVVIR